MSPTPSQSTAMPDQTHHLIGGILGGFASTVTLYPLELLKTRMQVIESSGVLKAGSMYNATRTILSNEGVRGLYQGVTPAIVASSGSWGAYFYLYEASKLRRKNSSAASLGVSDHVSYTLACIRFIHTPIHTHVHSQMLTHALTYIHTYALVT